MRVLFDSAVLVARYVHELATDFVSK